MPLLQNLRNVRDRIRTKVKRTAEELKHAWNEVREAGRETCQVIKKRYDEWLRKLKERRRLREIKDTYHGYNPEESDIVAARKVKAYLDENYGSNIGQAIVGMSSDQRIETFNEIVRKTEDILEVEVKDVVFFQPERGQERLCGSYNREDNKIYLNELMITSDHPEQIQEQVYTVFHELMHARQYAAITGLKDYGYSKKLLLEWANNFRDYTSPYVNDELYHKQPVERDTFGFEALIKGNVTIEDLRAAANIN